MVTKLRSQHQRTGPKKSQGRTKYGLERITNLILTLIVELHLVAEENALLLNMSKLKKERLESEAQSMNNLSEGPLGPGTKIMGQRTAEMLGPKNRRRPTEGVLVLKNTRRLTEGVLDLKT